MTESFIKIYHTDIVSFYNSCNNPAIIQSLENVYALLIQNTMDIVTKHHSVNQESQIINIMTQLKSEIKDSVNSITETVLDKLSNHLYNIHQVIDKSISAINPEHITNTLKLYISESNDKNSATTLNEINKIIKINISFPISELQSKLVEQIYKIPELLAQSSNTEDVLSKINNVSDKWTSSIDTILTNIKAIDSNTQNHNLKTAIHDAIKDLEQNTSTISNVITDIRTQLSSSGKDIGAIQSSYLDVKSKLDGIDRQLLIKNIKQTNNSSIKGYESENKLLDLLNIQLSYKQGYNITSTGIVKYSCDILVQRDKFPDILIENKDYKMTVNKSEVDKFIRDVTYQNKHGIFVSASTPIVNKGSLELIQLPNGKFTIYLSNNNYNVDLIIDMINLIYKLDSITASVDQSVHISHENLLLIQNEIRSITTNISSIKSHLEQSLSLLKLISNNTIEKILVNQLSHTKHKINKPIVHTSHTDLSSTSIEFDNTISKIISDYSDSPISNKFKCDKCSKVYTSKKGFTKHVCKSSELLKHI